MFNTGVSPVVNLGDYTFTLSPQNGYLRIDGEYELHSNFSVPDNLFEIEHKFPSQLVDNVYLRTTGKSCRDIYPNLKCSIYKSSSFIDIKNDSQLKLAGKENSSTVLETKLFLNQRLEKKLFHHELWNPSYLNSLKRLNFPKILKHDISFKNYYYLSDKDISKSSGLISLQLLDSFKITNRMSKAYIYHKIGIYLSSSQEIKSGEPILSLWTITDKQSHTPNLKIKTLSGWIDYEKSSSAGSTRINLSDFEWKNKETDRSIYILGSEKLREINNDRDDFLSGKLDLAFAITIGESTNIIQLKSKFPEEILSKKIHSPIKKVTINPYDFFLKRHKVDHTWIVESM